MTKQQPQQQQGSGETTRQYVRPQLMSYFRKHPGVTVWLDDICTELKVTNPRKVQQGIGNMRQDEPVVGAYIEVVRPGQAWVYKPPAVEGAAVPAQPAPAAPAFPSQGRNELFEKLGMLQDESALLRDEGGNIWTARRM